MLLGLNALLSGPEVLIDTATPAFLKAEFDSWSLWTGGCDSVIMQLPPAMMRRDQEKLDVTTGYDQDAGFRFIGDPLVTTGYDQDAGFRFIGDDGGHPLG